MDWNFLTNNKESISVSTDTRNLPAGCVFFALKGSHFNGNRFAIDSLRKGAAYAVVDEDLSQEPDYTLFANRIVRVENSLMALQDLARTWRRKWGRKIIAITGTNGKTTTKELTATVLRTRYNIHYTQGNLNNQIGVPLTLLQLTTAHQMAIIEMGASHPGDIKELVEIAEPDCGLITNVGMAHLQGFGSFEGVKQTKAELYDYLRVHNGFAFRNMDNPWLEDMAGTLPTVGYHTGKLPEGTHLVGEYNAENVSAALCIGAYFGINHEEALQAIRSYLPDNNRSMLKRTAHNTLIVDAYNANPTSMRASVLSFLHSPESPEERVLILGDMLELGEHSHTEHQNIVNLLLEHKTEGVYLIGKEFEGTTAPYPIYPDAQAFAHYLSEHPLTDKTILLKGSRGIHLETLTDRL